MLLLVALLTGFVTANSAQAAGWGSPIHASYPSPKSPHFAYNGNIGFQAAPWYLYWPYDAHFQTPAPVFGVYSAPPGFGPGASYGMPFFPAQPGYAPGSPMNVYPYGPAMAPGYAR